MAGDHAHAKQFSREARENFKTAEKLHAQAAEEILYSRNAGRKVRSIILYLAVSLSHNYSKSGMPEFLSAT